MDFVVTRRRWLSYRLWALMAVPLGWQATCAFTAPEATVSILVDPAPVTSVEYA